MLTPIEHGVLRRLIAAGRLEVGQAEDLVQMLDLHRVKDATATITDLIIARRIATPHEVNEMLAEEEQVAAAPIPHRQAAPLQGREPHGAHPQQWRPPPRHRPAVQHATPSKSSSNLMLYLGLAFWVLLLAGGGTAWVLYERGKQPELAGGTAGETPLVDSAPVASPAPAIASSYEAELAKAIEVTHLRRRLDSLKELGTRFPDAAQRAKLEYTRELDKVGRLAEADLRRATPDLRKYREAGTVSPGLAIYDELLERYGSDVLGGRIKKEREDYMMGKPLPSGPDVATDAATKAVERTVAKAGDIEGRKVDTPAEGSGKGEEAAPPPAPVDPAPGGAAPPAGNGQPSDAAKKYPNQERITRISDRLSELFTGKATLDEDGMLSVHCDFSRKSMDDVGDWSPTVDETPSLEKNVRWTVQREDEWNVAGIKISDDGWFVHNARLKPPIEMNVNVYIQNMFHPTNFFAACWVTSEKGRGVAGAYGKQLSLLQGFKPQKRQPPELDPIAATRAYQFKLNVSPGSYTTSIGRKEQNPLELPADLTSAQCALVWQSKISVIVSSVSFSGLLDLDWAEKQLDRKK